MDAETSFPGEATEWFHGSPVELSTLLAGSTITPDRDLARVFSHKPSLVSQGYEGDERHIKHSGEVPGYLYRVAEPLTAADVRPHPTTTMGPGQEWLTGREVRVALIGPTATRADESLTKAEIAELRVRARRARQ